MKKINKLFFYNYLLVFCLTCFCTFCNYFLASKFGSISSCFFFGSRFGGSLVLFSASSFLLFPRPRGLGAGNCLPALEQGRADVHGRLGVGRRRLGCRGRLTLPGHGLVGGQACRGPTTGSQGVTRVIGVKMASNGQEG